MKREKSGSNSGGYTQKWQRMRRRWRWRKKGSKHEQTAGKYF